MIAYMLMLTINAKVYMFNNKKTNSIREEIQKQQACYYNTKIH
jgi:Na+/melibiose symporter-like transporter